MRKKRVFLIVLDSVGIGDAPDAEAFGDVGTHTLRGAYRTGLLDIPNLRRLGLCRIDGLSFLGEGTPSVGAVARLREASRGKDTTIGHWELAGHISQEPLPTFPEGFPRDFLEKFSRRVGRGFLCNRPYSGTKVISDYGEEHLRTGKLIVYTSADSVFQIAAHEDAVPLEELYRICETAREMLTGKLGVGRVIARPFTGKAPHFTRTENRRDYSLEPPRGLLPERVLESGMESVAVGKIGDIFAERGFSRILRTHSNQEGMARTEELMREDFSGLCFVNLVDFDMLWGHRRDAEAYARGLSEFDMWLGSLLPLLGKEDLLMITADHGCDPTFLATTDHTREDVPLIVYAHDLAPTNFGIRESFSCVGATVESLLGLTVSHPERVLPLRTI
ncbi:MAG: phosphopentomutase [Clostridia bacterium]|nr:phosphopentomutase [Clostridia bacterium]